MTMTGNQMNRRYYTVFCILLLFLLSTLIMLRQLASPYYFSCFVSDTYAYSSWAWQFRETLREGVIYPRWMPLDFWGYGSPTFILYSPLAFYMVAVLDILSNSLVTAMTLTKFLSLFISATGVFLLVREIYPERVALLTGSFFIFLPSYVSSLYIGGAFTSSISLMWFPLILLFLLKYIKSEQYAYSIYAGACYAGLILTHLINAYMFTFVLVAFIIYMSIVKKRLADLIGIPIVILTGILMSAAYFLPFIYEKQFLNYHVFLENYADRFILPNHLNKVDPNYFWSHYYYEIASFVIAFFIITSLLLLQMTKSQRLNNEENDAKTVNKFFIGVSFFSIFLMFGISAFVWENVPFFKFIQIPVRWLSVSAFAIVLSSSSFFSKLESISLSKRKRFLILAMPFFLCIVLDLKYMLSACTFNEQELIPVQAVNRPEHMPAGINTAKISNEGDFKDKVLIVNGLGKVEDLSWKSEERIIKTSADQPITVKIRTFNFPGWTAYIDGVRTGIQTEDESGAMLIDIPESDHTLVLKFVDTPIRYYSKLVSLSSLFIIFFAYRPGGRLFTEKKRDGRE